MKVCRYHSRSTSLLICSLCKLELCTECAAAALNPATEILVCPLCDGHMEQQADASIGPSLWTSLPNVLTWPWALMPSLILGGMAILMVMMGQMPAISMELLWSLTASAGAYAVAVLHVSSQGKGQVGALSVWRGQGQAVLASVLVQGGAQMLLLLALQGALRYVVLVVFLESVALPLVYLGLGQGKMPGSLINRDELRSLLGPVLMPYALLSVILVMLAGLLGGFMDLLSDILPQAWNWALAAVLFNYFAWVSARAVGLFIFQEPALGQERTPRQVRLRSHPAQARLSVWLREGEYARAKRQLRLQAESVQATVAHMEAYHQLLMNLLDIPALQVFADQYLRRVVIMDDEIRVLSLLREYQEKIPGFVPGDPELRWHIAQMLVRMKALKQAAHMLNGLHKDAPNFAHLPEAYLLAAAILNDLGFASKAKALLRFLLERYKNHALYPMIKERWQRLSDAESDPDTSLP
ncbi:MAG: hypothetical protein HKM02_00995 [Pseudomonadales bacterium]|nr:hypothetical protein [Pseudomonadales bacterium]